ncbi:hypothetical protein, partial [uncultured Dubosiella sp.]|uniref:hypothetical protein n=2 Tax=uncultured Dubosiella sp. TaxID=1937011 RepID=UPI0026082469
RSFILQIENRKELLNMSVNHLEPEEFVEKAFSIGASITCRVYVTNNHLAVKVYLLHDKDDLYFMDCPITTHENRKVLEETDFNELHADLYQKIALDERLRMQRT